MISMNKVLISGNLGADVQSKATPQGFPVADFSLAVARKTASRDEVFWIPVIALGKTAENCLKYLKKGSGVLVEGYLRSDSWDDKQTGQRRSRNSVIAERVQFLSNHKVPREETPENGAINGEYGATHPNPNQPTPGASNAPNSPYNSPNGHPPASPAPQPAPYFPGLDSAVPF